MPAFEKLFQEYGEEFSILAVNCQEDKESVDSFLSENDYTFPIAYDEDGDVCSKYPTDGIPYTLVIGKDGTIKQTFLGARGADEQYEMNAWGSDNGMWRHRIKKGKTVRKYARLNKQEKNAGLHNSCVPGLNCYSCPGAVAACPLGFGARPLRRTNAAETAAPSPFYRH